LTSCHFQRKEKEDEEQKLEERKGERTLKFQKVDNESKENSVKYSIYRGWFGWKVKV